jgi:hypothetical protein
LHKSINYIPHWNRNPVDGVLDLDECSQDCVLITGAWGAFRGTNKPIFQVMGSYPFPLPDNIPDELAHLRYGFGGTPPDDVGQSYYRYWDSK